MREAKLVKILKTLTKDEWKYLRWFAQSNFFNTDPNLLVLYEALARHYPSFDSKALNKEGMFAKIFTGQPFNDAKWRNLLLKMNKLLEDYLVWLELEEEETSRQKLLVSAYGRRNLYQQFENSTEDLLEILERRSRFSADAQREKALLNLQFYRHQQTSKIMNREKLLKASEELDIYYCAEKLRLACEVKVFENIVIGASQIRFAEGMIEYAQENLASKFAYTGVYSNLFQLLYGNSQSDRFQTTLEHFVAVSTEISLSDKQFGLLHLLNYAINQSNKGEANYRNFVLRLYKLGLEWEVLLLEGEISSNTFVNIVSNGSALGEYEWTSDFIKSYESKLDPSVREETISIGLGYLNFFKKDYASTIEVMRNVQFKDFNFDLTSKLLLIRSFYGLFESDYTYYNLFAANSKALVKYIQRNKLLPDKKKEWYINFENMLSKLARLIYQGKFNKKSKASLLEEAESKEMVLKPWLLEKIQG